jgi:hypothetical protein
MRMIPVRIEGMLEVTRATGESDKSRRWGSTGKNGS